MNGATGGTQTGAAAARAAMIVAEQQQLCIFHMIFKLPLWIADDSMPLILCLFPMNVRKATSVDQKQSIDSAGLVS